MDERPPISKSRLVRGLLMVAGTLALGLGLIGIFLPLLPTTPFLLLAAACYFRSSQRLYDWLMSHRWISEPLRQYHNGQGIPLKTKLVALISLWLSISLSAWLVVPGHMVWAKALLALIALAVSMQIVTLPTRR